MVLISKIEVTRNNHLNYRYLVCNFWISRAKPVSYNLEELLISMKIHNHNAETPVPLLFSSMNLMTYQNKLNLRGKAGYNCSRVDHESHKMRHKLWESTEAQKLKVIILFPQPCLSSNDKVVAQGGEESSSGNGITTALVGALVVQPRPQTCSN